MVIVWWFVNVILLSPAGTMDILTFKNYIHDSKMNYKLYILLQASYMLL